MHLDTLLANDTLNPKQQRFLRRLINYSFDKTSYGYGFNYTPKIHPHGQKRIHVNLFSDFKDKYPEVLREIIKSYSLDVEKTNTIKQIEEIIKSDSLQIKHPEIAICSLLSFKNRASLLLPHSNRITQNSLFKILEFMSKEIRLKDKT